MNITVVGQGYVGIPLAIEASKAGYKVFGLDLNIEKINQLISGKSLVPDISDETIQLCIDSKMYIPTTDQNVISKSNIVLICVPTPLTPDGKPDLTILIKALTQVGKIFKKGTLIIIESTIDPGTTRDILLPILLQESGFGLADFDLAYSPERIDPSNQLWNIKNTPKLVSGLTNSSAKRAEDFYKKFVAEIHLCSSLEIAETAKLLENTFRFVNISFVNELSIFCHKIGIEVSEVIKAAATKPYGFMAFYPSIGIGGHCIPVDPIYLAAAAKAKNMDFRFIDIAEKINAEIPKYFVMRSEQILTSLKGKRILVIGVSYKPNVSDVRETPVESLITELELNGAQVFWHDDLVKEWNNQISVDLSNNYDLAILATPHNYLDLNKIGNTPLIDTRRSIS